MRKFFNCALFALFLASCSLLPTSTQTDISNFLAGLSNKVTGDLQTALATAQTPAVNLPGNMIDQAGAICLNGSSSPQSIGGLIGAQKEINAILKNANVAAAGGVTAVEVATLIQPGSPQMNALATGVAADCGPKIAQVSSAVAGTQAWFAALAGQFAIQLAPAGL